MNKTAHSAWTGVRSRGRKGFREKGPFEAGL